ncbi:MAG: hypothetical protein WDO13_02650 [Verrucomicrobiota bacterium]
MTTRQRIDLLARAEPRLFPRADLVRMVRAQLGHVDALDRWTSRDGTRALARRAADGPPPLRRQPRRLRHHQPRARAGPRRAQHRQAARRPRRRFHAPRHFLVHPRPARAAAWSGGNAARARRRCPPPRRCGHRLRLRRDDGRHPRKLRFDQTFVPHGHALSLLWIGEPEKLAPRQARACAVDVLTYDQLGCPVAAGDLRSFRRGRRGAGRKARARTGSGMARPAAQARAAAGHRARIAEARDVAFALGHRVWLPPRRHLGWTLIHDPGAAFAPSPLHGVIVLREAGETALPQALAPVAGRISTVGAVGQISSRLRGGLS